MGTFLLGLSLLMGIEAFGQATPPAPQPTQAAPAAPAAPRRSGAAARTEIIFTVTDGRGAPLSGVHVTLGGVSDRSGETDSGGRVGFAGVQPGTYRARFDGDAVTSFEREVIVRTGKPTMVDVTLNPAPPPPPPPPPPPAPAPAAPVVGPAGTPQVLSVADLAEKQLEGNQPRKETLLACSGNMRTMLVLLNQDQPDRLSDTAETAYYVVAGQGAVRVNGRDTPLVAGTFVSLPRKTAHSLTRRGNRPLILLATLGGEPCKEAK